MSENHQPPVSVPTSLIPLDNDLLNQIKLSFQKADEEYNAIFCPDVSESNRVESDSCSCVSLTLDTSNTSQSTSRSAKEGLERSLQLLNQELINAEVLYEIDDQIRKRSSMQHGFSGDCVFEVNSNSPSVAQSDSLGSETMNLPPGLEKCKRSSIMERQSSSTSVVLPRKLKQEFHKVDQCFQLELQDIIDFVPPYFAINTEFSTQQQQKLNESYTGILKHHRIGDEDNSYELNQIVYELEGIGVDGCTTTTDNETIDIYAISCELEEELRRADHLFRYEMEDQLENKELVHLEISSSFTTMSSSSYNFDKECSCHDAIVTPTMSKDQGGEKQVETPPIVWIKRNSAMSDITSSIVLDGCQDHKSTDSVTAATFITKGSWPIVDDSSVVTTCSNNSFEDDEMKPEETPIIDNRTRNQNQESVFRECFHNCNSISTPTEKRVHLKSSIDKHISADILQSNIRKVGYEDHSIEISLNDYPSRHLGDVDGDKSIHPLKPERTFIEQEFLCNSQENNEHILINSMEEELGTLSLPQNLNMLDKVPKIPSNNHCDKKQTPQLPLQLSSSFTPGSLTYGWRKYQLTAGVSPNSPKSLSSFPSLMPLAPFPLVRMVHIGAIKTSAEEIEQDVANNERFMESFKISESKNGERNLPLIFEHARHWKKVPVVGRPLSIPIDIPFTAFRRCSCHPSESSLKKNPAMIIKRLK